MSAESAADVPDEVLRPALELAVGVAASGAKLRPPLAFPVGLKRFLRFHKLPPAALAQVREAIEGDADFRKRLGSVATADLVDDVGVLWLSRPDGWARSIAELLPRKVVDEGPALRREERRRLAAEEAAARGRAELLGVMAELDRERVASIALVAERDRLTVEVDEVRARLREAQRAEHATAQILAKVESELHQARSAIPRAQPDAPAPPVADAATLRRLIGGAVSASTDSVRLLTAALDELAEVEATATGTAARVHRDRVWRKAVRLPGGVLAGTVEAAEFFLRIKGAVVLTDGYNIAKLGWPSLELAQQRAQCIVACENMAKRWNMAMTIVFDGAAVEGAHSPARRKVRITYSPEGVSADDVLRAEVAAADVARPVVVVTNDRAILTDVTAAGANTVSSDHFLVLLRR